MVMGQNFAIDPEPVPMRVLLRVAATFVMVIPVFLVLVIVFALEARRGLAPIAVGASAERAT